MKKYEKLAKAYRVRAERIKSAEAAKAEAIRRYNAIYRELGEEADWSQEAYDLSLEIDQLHDMLNAHWEQLHRDLDDEYDDVPFAAPREQGKKKLLELLGLD